MLALYLAELKMPVCQIPKSLSRRSPSWPATRGCFPPIARQHETLRTAVLLPKGGAQFAAGLVVRRYHKPLARADSEPICHRELSIACGI